MTAKQELFNKWLNKINWSYYGVGETKLLSNKESLLERVKQAKTDEDLLRIFFYIFVRGYDQYLKERLKELKNK